MHNVRSDTYGGIVEKRDQASIFSTLSIQKN